MLYDVYEARDIDSVEHFSYSQFYVLYDRFVLLDRRQDFRLSEADLREFYSADCLTRRMVDRIFAVNLTSSSRERSNKEGEMMMSYTDWVVFLKVL